MNSKNAHPLPNLVIIGSQKCGTTSLHRYLSLHPEICMSKDKELDFFAEEGTWSRGVDWYRSNFSGQAARIYGESSPNYTHYPFWLGIPQRMHSMLPEAKLIFLVRDPIDRTLAQYVHHVAARLENRPLAEALHVCESNPYVIRSLYHLQLSQFLEFYPLSRVLVVDQFDLKMERRRTLHRIFRFLGINDEFSSPLMKIEAHRTRDKRRLTASGQRLADSDRIKALGEIPHVGGTLERFLLLPFSRRVRRPEPSPQLRRRLMEFIKPDVARFRALTGQSFSNWSM